MNGVDVTEKCAVFFNGEFGGDLKTLPPNGFFAFNFDRGLQVITGFTYYEGYTFLRPFVFSP
jgi:hypothetical protein